MGLDMYLTAKKYLWSDADKEVSEQISDLIGVKSDYERRFNGSSLVVKGVEVDAMYWRKANAIHDWFVRNVQDGEDDCREYWVGHEKLAQLIEQCKKALESHDPEIACEILPPASGFFFGSTEIDEYYWQDLQETVEGLERALTLPERDYSFFYQSSW